MRPRAASSASSISCSSRAGKRVFSPTASTATLTPAPAISAVAASPEPPDAHHRRTTSGVVDSLKDSLKHADDDRGGLGLGLAFPRRGLHVHSKEELDATSPRDSGGSLSSESTAGAGHTRTRTLSRLSGFWRNTKEEEDAAEQVARRAQMDEIAVEREMAREEAEDVKETEDFEIVRKRAKSASTTKSSSSTTPVNTAFPAVIESDDEDAPPRKKSGDRPPLRIVLPDPGRGRIVHLAVFEDVGQLVALRDVGLLDILSLSDLALTSHIDLDAATPNKERKLLSLAWLWRRVHLAAREEVRSMCYLLTADTPGNTPRVQWHPVALYWAESERRGHPRGHARSPDARVCRDSRPAWRRRRWSRLQWRGWVADCVPSANPAASYLLHGTPTSLMSYHIIFPNSAPPSRTTTPQPPKSPVASVTTSPLSSPLLSRPSPRSPSSSRYESSGLTKFLATRRIASRKIEAAVEAPQPGVDGGVECQRDGGGHWSAIRLHDNGHGVGVGDGHVEAFEFDGAKLTLRGSIPVSGKIDDVAFTSGWHDICVVTDTETLILAREGRLKPATQTWAARKTYPARAASIATGSLYAVEKDAVVNVDLGTLERRVEAKLQAPVAGEHVCPLGADLIFAADERGNVRKQTLTEYLHHTTPSDGGTTVAADRLDSPVTCSAIVASELAVGGQFLVMGDEEGTVRIWDARWVAAVVLTNSQQATPLARIVDTVRRRGALRDAAGRGRGGYAPRVRALHLIQGVSRGHLPARHGRTVPPSRRACTFDPNLRRRQGHYARI
jgi:hypothetical protein